MSSRSVMKTLLSRPSVTAAASVKEPVQQRKACIYSLLRFLYWLLWALCGMILEMNIYAYHSSYLTAGESEEMAQEDFQYKLKVYIDSTVDKRFVFFQISE